MSRQAHVPSALYPLDEPAPKECLAVRDQLRARRRMGLTPFPGPPPLRAARGELGGHLGSPPNHNIRTTSLQADLIAKTGPHSKKKSSSGDRLARRRRPVTAHKKCLCASSRLWTTPTIRARPTIWNTLLAEARAPHTTTSPPFSRTRVRPRSEHPDQPSRRTARGDLEDDFPFVRNQGHGIAKLCHRLLLEVAHDVADDATVGFLTLTRNTPARGTARPGSIAPAQFRTWFAKGIIYDPNRPSLGGFTPVV